jgi:glycolate oxidase
VKYRENKSFDFFFSILLHLLCKMNNYSAVEPQDISIFKHVLGEDGMLLKQEEMRGYASDATEDFVFMPEIVLIPSDESQLATVLKHCNQRHIPVTVRGAGTGLSGGALPVMGGVILSMEKFNRILEIDTNNLQATVEPGVINEFLQQSVQELGLFYPPDPASKGSCFLGGNVALSSGGPRALKYGTTRDYILNLKVVLPDGEIFWTGANTLKYSTGYNLTHLMIGSEGTLAVVTQIRVKLIPYPMFRQVMLVPFKKIRQACEAVSLLFRKGLNPSALEFMERDAIDLTCAYIGVEGFSPDAEAEAQLLIEFDGNNLEHILQELEKTYDLLTAFETGEILLAQDESDKNRLWKLRRSVAEAVRASSVYKEEDTVVPRAQLPELIEGVKEIGRKYGFRSVCYGHAGDGNLHINILKGSLSDDFWEHEIHDAIAEIFILCKNLGGTISGEHGIGYVQKRYMHLVQSPAQLELMKAIKKVFDPNEILNPGKIFC